jgi:peptidoglycan/xylan/chitin deacetylase (PgdA/CDA1 family)
MRSVSLRFHDVFASDPAESGFRSPAADRYKLSLPDFEAQLDGLLRARRDSGLGSRDSRLTFDDGGVSYYTLIADRLESHGWRGSCFVSTDFVGRTGFLTAEQIRDLDARGHTIGSHTASHPPRFSTLTPARMRVEWGDSRKRLEDIVGHAVTVASVPGGYFSSDVAAAAADAGIRTLFTSEPTTRLSEAYGLTLIGRYAIRRGQPADMAQRFALASPWTRCSEWAAWNAKAIAKPILGASYARIADWLLAGPCTTDTHHA